jgi:hypothetical protein
MNVRDNIAGDVLASLSTMLWNIPSEAWSGGAPMADASLKGLLPSSDEFRVLLARSPDMNRKGF